MKVNQVNIKFAFQTVRINASLHVHKVVACCIPCLNNHHVCSCTHCSLEVISIVLHLPDERIETELETLKRKKEFSNRSIDTSLVKFDLACLVSSLNLLSGRIFLPNLCCQHKPEGLI